jgi:hypothetical protein
MFLIAIIFSICSSQGILQNKSVILNTNGALSWDFYKDQLLYYSKGEEILCKVSTASCTHRKVNYTATTYIIGEKLCFLHDETREKIFRLDSNGNGTEYKLDSSKYLPGYKPLFLNSRFIYLTSLELSSIEIYSVTNWGDEKLNSVNTLSKRHKFWYLENEELYSIETETLYPVLRKYSIEGKYLLWTQDISYCTTKIPLDEIFIAASPSVVFVLCSPSRLISLYNSTDGNLLNQYATDNGKIMAAKCSQDFLFILYSDASIMQYTMDFNYVYRFTVENSTLPNYNTLKVDSDHLSYVACFNNCSNAYIFILSFEKQPAAPFVVYSLPKEQESYGSSKMTREPNYRYNNAYYISPNLNSTTVDHISNFNPAMYLGTDEQIHLIYYSGRNLAKGTCGDIFFHDLIVTELFSGERIQASTMLNQKYMPLGGPNTSLSDYASILLNFDKKKFYLIHGGLSCDYLTTYSDMFAIDVQQRQYIKLSQNNSIG